MPKYQVKAQRSAENSIKKDLCFFSRPDLKTNTISSICTTKSICFKIGWNKTILK